MADSDDESERRRSRDKFRRERSDYDNRRRPGDKREPFDDRSNAALAANQRGERRPNPDRQYNSGNRERQSPEPPYKRPRRDYEDYRPYRRRVQGNEDESIYRPPLMPFKRFLEPLDDLITDTEACSKYREYKGGFMKRYIDEFFEAHKSEEWLRLKYHPDHIDKHKATMTFNVRNRLSVFLDLLSKGYIENQSVQMDNSENLIKLMDSVVIKLEGGTDDDLNVLDEHDRHRYSEDEWNSHEKRSPSGKRYSGASGHKSEEGEAESDVDGEESEKEEGEKPSKLKRTDKTEPKKPTPSSRKSSRSPSASSSSRSGSAEASGDEHVEHDSNSGAEDSRDRSPKTYAHAEHPDESKPDEALGSIQDDDEDDVPTPTTAEAPGGGALSPTDSASVLLSASITGPPTTPSVMSQDALQAADGDASNVTAEGNNRSTDPLVHKTPSTHPLHKTASIFFRALPPSLMVKELDEVCASQPGFLRLAMWDPVPERRFMRHAWATYKPDVNIKKICWVLNTNVALREKLSSSGGEVGATVNRELAQRVRPLTPLTRHKPIMRQDLMLAARLVARLDAENGLWTSASSSGNFESSIANGIENSAVAKVSEVTSFTISGTVIESANPLLKNLTDHLVDEGGGEEALLAGVNSSNDADGNRTNNSVVLESDAELAHALDRLILYLRIVHSVDFYSGAVYPMEDSMPHRCGILHARGDRGLNAPAIGGRSSGLVFTRREVDEYLQNFYEKLKPLLEIPRNLTDEELKTLGLRDPEKVAEEFIEANIQKRTGKKKPFKVVWVCPLSDKKFREPIFVRKHILNKHMDKVEAVKKDNAIFFNNYLKDPRRPALPEAPSHMVGQFYPPSSGCILSYRGLRGQGTGRINTGNSGYRGPHRSNVNNPVTALLPNTYASRAGGFQDYYDAAAAQQQQQAMAAVAAAAAAALYQNPAADLYALAAGGGGQRGAGGRRHGLSPNRDGSRMHHTGAERRPNVSGSGGYGGRRRYGSKERGVISYTDLDDPGRDNA